MFRLKVPLTLIILFLIQALVTYFVFQQQVVPTVLEDTDIALQRSAILIEKTHRLDQYSLAEKARFVAQRPTILRAMTAEYEGDAEYNRHVEMHKQLETELLRFQQQARRLEGERNLDLELLHRRPSTQELFMALDETGRGVATLGRDLAHWMGDNVAKDFPVVLEAMERGEVIIDIWNWSYQANNEGQLYTVAISPIPDPDTGESVGVIVLGNLMNDGVAARDQALITSGFVQGGNAPEARQQVHAPEVLFFRGGRIRSSTLNTRSQQQVSQSLFEDLKVQEFSIEHTEKMIDLTIDNRQYRAVVRFFSGQEGSSEAAGIILLTNYAHSVSPITAGQRNLIFLVAILLLVGLITFFAFHYTYEKSFQKLEDGVQVIISGEKDYIFEPIPTNPVADGLAQHLNLLSAYLQGKPMPDDDPSSSGWGDLGGAPGTSEEESKPAVSGVPLGLGAKKAPEKPEKEEESV